MFLAPESNWRDSRGPVKTHTYGAPADGRRRGGRRAQAREQIDVQPLHDATAQRKTTHHHQPVVFYASASAASSSSKPLVLPQLLQRLTSRHARAQVHVLQMPKSDVTKHPGVSNVVKVSRTTTPMHTYVTRRMARRRQRRLCAHPSSVDITMTRWLATSGL